MEFTFRQTYINTANLMTVYGTKKIKVDEKFTYVSYNEFNSPLIFIQDIKFGNEKYYNISVGKDIEIHSIFRADGIDDFVVIRKYNGNKYIFDRIDFMNVEYRL
jgi:hypothetical protein